MRSARIASSTPGYWTFTATSRPSCSRARCTCPIDAAAIGFGSHAAKTRSGASTEFGLHDARGELRRHRWCVLLQRRERIPHGLGHAFVEVAHHLPDLHRARPSCRRGSRPPVRSCASGARHRARRAPRARRSRGVRGARRRPLRSGRRPRRVGHCGWRRSSPRAGPRSGPAARSRRRRSRRPRRRPWP